VFARTYIHVTGPQGAGKTTFIETFLQTTMTSVLVARGRCDEGLRRAREASPRGDPELQRYRRAGATRTAMFTFPPGPSSFEEFFESDLMRHYSDGVIIEGDAPPCFGDESIYIAPPLPRGASFFVREQRRPTPARSAERWTIRGGYEDIELASIVAVNVRAQRDTDGALRLLGDLARLRSDRTLFDEVVGWRGNRTPITSRRGRLVERGRPRHAKGAGAAPTHLAGPGLIGVTSQASKTPMHLPRPDAARELLIRARTLPIRILSSEGEEEPDASWQRLRCKILRDDVEDGAVALIYAVSALSFHDARPRGVSEIDYQTRDAWTTDDLCRHLRYVRGALCLDADYVRGRM
jgi:hypothetical protein